MEIQPSTDEITSRRMSRQKTKDTGPEVELRRELRQLGVGYRIEYALPGMPRRRCDIAFIGAKVAVFVDGCFWHSCPSHTTVPSRNLQWWVAKLAANVARDRDTDSRLSVAGWMSIRVWEHEDMAAAAQRIAEAVRARR
jgi:DNA mismatch endonuclease (patch repair protein)